ncbi:MAG: ABC transporter ATP-binding protein, partial [Deltaproteobacteria bacterium]|nr:ABC transporter ATP-binding protein [Deltaproteobacteria bacterium]
QRRKEAELRAKQNQGVKPLEKRVATLEETIAKLEKVIAEHNAELSKPDVYDDAERRDTLLREVQEAQTELERSFAEWTECNEKLEQLRAEIEAAS